MSIGNERARLRLLNTPSQKVSLVDLPCIVCLNVFSRLDTKDILSLYNSCNPFRRLIGNPTPESHRNWNLHFEKETDWRRVTPYTFSLGVRHLPLYEILHLGSPYTWIMTITTAFYQSPLEPQLNKCRICYESRRSSKVFTGWELGVAMCNDCVQLHTIRYFIYSLII
jgi:hypothetical protein